MKKKSLARDFKRKLGPNYDPDIVSQYYAIPEHAEMYYQTLALCQIADALTDMNHVMKYGNDYLPGETSTVWPEA